MLVCACSLDHQKNLFGYASSREYVLGIDGTIEAQRHATGSCGACGHRHLLVAFPGGSTDGTGGTLKRILRGGVSAGYFGYAA